MHEIIEVASIVEHLTSETPCVVNRITNPDAKPLDLLDMEWDQLAMNWGWKSRDGFNNRFFVDTNSSIIYEINSDQRTIQPHKGEPMQMFYDAVKLSEYGNYFVNATPERVAEEFTKNGYQVLK